MEESSGAGAGGAEPSTPSDLVEEFVVVEAAEDGEPREVPQIPPTPVERFEAPPASDRDDDEEGRSRRAASAEAGGGAAATGAESSGAGPEDPAPPPRSDLPSSPSNVTRSAAASGGETSERSEAKDESIARVRAAAEDTRSEGAAMGGSTTNLLPPETAQSKSTPVGFLWCVLH